MLVHINDVADIRLSISCFRVLVYAAAARHGHSRNQSAVLA